MARTIILVLLDYKAVETGRVLKISRAITVALANSIAVNSSAEWSDLQESTEATTEMSAEREPRAR